MFGNLTLSAFQHDAVITGAQVSMVLGAVGVAALLTYFKRWKWLWREWLTSLDPKKIGIMYIVVAFLMLLHGGVDAAMMRLQQAISVGSAHGYLEPRHFQQIFSFHGTIMIFFVAMGMMFGIINLILPLQIGSRDVAFPFLNSVSFWLFALAGILANLSIAVGQFSAAGWLAYPPLSELRYSPGVGVDYWIWTLQIAGAGSLLSGINFLTTIAKMRRPGMTLLKMPMFIWTVLCTMILVIFAFPILTATLTLLFMDRYFGMHFFTSYFGGNPMMYVNLIWAWGHPEVYILVLPAFGIFSEVVSVFSRKRLFGYVSMVFATAGITFLSFIVWLHHFFTMGAGADVNAFFGIMTMIIAVPTGVKIFNWLFTMFRGRISFTTPMLWFLGFVFTFTVGGMTGVLMAIPAADFQLHNSLFLVAHFHTMIIGGVLFGYFAGYTYWFPKFAGFKLNERIGRYAFWAWLVGFVLAFGPLYVLGLMGATRRLDHYSVASGWQFWFIIAGIGVAIIGLGVALQVLQLIVSIKDRKKNLVGNDPWDGRTLEWSVTSPPPFYNFSTLNIVHERDEFWAMKTNPNLVKEEVKYEDFLLPKNSAIGIYIAGSAFIMGFALIWHITWLAILGIIGIFVFIIMRSFDDSTMRVVSASEVQAAEARGEEFAPHAQIEEVSA